MGKLFNKVVFTFLLSFIFLISANAECTFKERKALLEEAKQVEAFFDVDYDNNKFIFYMYNLNDNLYAELENLSSNQSIEIHNYEIEGDYYTFDETNTTDRITYKLHIYANKSECYGNKLTSKNITKGIINKFSKQDICKGIEDFTYCKPVLSNKFTISDEKVIEKINEYKKSQEVKTEIEEKEVSSFIKFIKNYWKYILIIVVGVSLVVLILLFINKRRGELK